jgi:hypothetical protein
MRLCVEHPLVQGQGIVFSEEKVQVLESVPCGNAGYQSAFHHRKIDMIKAHVSARKKLGMLFPLFVGDPLTSFNVTYPLSVLVSLSTASNTAQPLFLQRSSRVVRQRM